MTIFSVVNYAVDDILDQLVSALLVFLGAMVISYIFACECTIPLLSRNFETSS